MRFSDADGRKVVSTSSAETVGKVDGFVVDPQQRRIVAVEVKKTASGDTLMWSAVVGFGADAVTVADAHAITERSDDIAALAGKEHRLKGKRILSGAGDVLGHVDDVEFDPESGQIQALITGERDVAGERLMGIGSYAVVVRAV
ncbi:MAG: PRC-barrel domain-containing protein [Acidimicrobiales bacterium]